MGPEHIGGVFELTKQMTFYPSEHNDGLYFDPGELFVVVEVNNRMAYGWLKTLHSSGAYFNFWLDEFEESFKLTHDEDQ